jgi:hypothetical protein
MERKSFERVVPNRKAVDICQRAVGIWAVSDCVIGNYKSLEVIYRDLDNLNAGDKEGKT